MAHSRHSIRGSLKGAMPRYRDFSAAFSKSKIIVAEQVLSMVAGDGWWGFPSSPRLPDSG